MSTLYVNNIQPVSGSNLTLISASLVTVDELTVSGITGSLFGTASFATSASYAVSASYEINYETSSSYADYAVTASYALNSTPPGGSDGQIQFNSGSAFGADSNLFWDNTNKRLGVGTATPNTTLEIKTANTGDVDFVNFTNGNGINTARFKANGGYVLGASSDFSLLPATATLTRFAASFGFLSAPSAQVHIKGSGNTSSTTSLLVQNSSGTELLKVQDNGNFVLGSDKFIVYGPEGFTTTQYLDCYNFANFRSQVSVGSASLTSSAQLSVDSTTKGFLPPRMSDTQRDAISSPAEGLQVYNTSSKSLDVYDGTVWNRFGSSSYISGSLGIGTATPSKPLEVFGDALINAAANTNATLQIGNSSRRWDIKSIDSGAYYQLRYTSNQVIVQSIDYLGNTAIGNFAQATARLQVKGSGSTSATTSLLVQNSLGTELFTVLDDGSTRIGKAGGNVFFGPGTSNYLQNGYNWFGNYNALGTWNMGGATTEATAIVNIQSTTKGFLPPRMTETQKNAISTPAVGLMVYQTDATEGLYVYKSTGWTFVA